MERALIEKTQELGSALAEIQTLYNDLDNDLIEAKGLQQSLLPETQKDFGAAKVSIAL